jgi:dipeptidase
VALPPVTADGSTLFAKNSDRHPLECQRFVIVPAATHASGTSLRCQYIDIPQVSETARVLGSQPEWLWGFEHGVNEHGVAIGNEMVATREPAAAVGLLGMDLVRLGLERARSAPEAIEVITGLVERHGQGGSGQPNVDWAYHNGFIVSDPREAWILEASGRHWAARAVSRLGNISNHVSIAENWDRMGDDVAGFAEHRGWWAGDGRFDFAAAYRDIEGFPPQISECRYQRGRELLDVAAGRITSETLRGVLRDHYDSGPLYRPGRAPEDDRYFSLCMHAGELMSTTASMVATLDVDAPPVAWMALGTPCVSAFLPYYIDGELPPEVLQAGKDASCGALWWSFREVLTRVEADPGELGPMVRARWAALEAEVAHHAIQVEARASDLRARGDQHGVADLLTGFMASNVRALAASVTDLLDGAARR